MANRISVADRFWPKVDKVGPKQPYMDTQCWQWTAATSKFGYGKFGNNGGWEMAHRASYRINVGPIPEGLSVLHRCDNRKCVRPDHLFLGTYADNVHDCEAKGRGRHLSGDEHPVRKNPLLVPRGEAHPNAKLSDEQVRSIRAAYAGGGESWNSLARQYGVTKRCIGFIVNGQSRRSA